MSERRIKSVNPDLSVWKTKAEAAAILRCSEKTVERYAEKGDLDRKTRRVPGRRPLPVFSPDDLDRLQKESIQPQPARALGDAGTALAKIPRDVPSFLAELLTRSREPAVSTKTFLTVEEASKVSGLTQAYLRRKIHASELPAIKDGGWKIRRIDLDKI
jgi:excisionase family DNA binding protein